MKRNTAKIISLKHVLLLAVLTLVPLLSSCGGSDDPVAPTGVGWSPLTEMDVGPAGGTVTGDDFTVTVPDGAFESDATLLVAARPPEEHTMLDPRLDAVSTIYRVSGLPESREPLTIELAFDPAQVPAGLTPTIYFEEEVYLDDETEPRLAGWPLRDVTVDLVAGRVRGTIPPHYSTDPKDPQKSLADYYYVFTVVFTDLETRLTEDYYFQWKPGECDASYINALIVDFNASRDTLDAMGFRLELDTPIFVEVLVLEKEDGNFLQGKFEVSTSLIQINANSVGRERLAAAGHELFHMYQYEYGVRGHLLGYGYYWLREACSMWLEPILLNDVNYVPSIMSTNNGFMQTGLETNTAATGYGAGTFLIWLTEKYDRGLVLEALNYVKSNSSVSGVAALEAVLAARGENLAQEFVLFAGAFCTGLTSHEDWGAPSPETTMFTSSFTSQTVTIDAMDFSANSFMARLNPNTWPDPTPPHFLVVEVPGDTPSYIKAAVYKSVGPTLSVGLAGYASAGEPAEVSNFGVGGQRYVRVVLTNTKDEAPYTEVRPVSVTMRLATCPETAIAEPYEAYLTAHVYVSINNVPADSIPVTVVYNKVHCDGHLGTVGPVNGQTRSDGFYIAGTMAVFNVQNKQEVFRATATVQGITQSLDFTVGRLEGTWYFEPAIAEIEFQF
ncbi:MAG: hypothetical protein QNL91_14895 [Candidatus Krumholzibacteria bacterium]|nr:hypothetical protein [Candidatus Krumholzibacteria bacterium]